MKKQYYLIALIIILAGFLLWFGIYYPLICIGIVLTASIIYSVKLFMSWRSGGKLLNALNTQVTSEHQLEVDALQEKMKEAIAKLKASGIHAGYRGAAALYALPWYMIIGPSAAGKSTLLRNSDLNFPYSVNDQIDIKGFAGTRNCDWWFADEAIILDTAGRYTLEEADKPEWIGFLQLLRKFRRRSPIHGVIVALSLEDITASNKKNTSQHINLIRQKLDELNRELGIVIPVQLVITKCDLLEGFSQFFKDLSHESREQTWGVRLDNNDFKTALAGLLDRLSDWRLHKLSMHPQLEHKHEIMRFPKEFEGALEKVASFLEALTKQNHFQEQPDFRGIYFTSALQEIKPEANTLVRSYFIKDLFRKIIFQQKFTAKNIRQKKLHKGLMWISAMAGLVLTVIAAMMLQSGYQLQRELYTKEEHMLNSLKLNAADPSENFIKIYHHYSFLKDLEAKHYWRFMLGINSLQPQIEKSQSLFTASFTQVVLPVIHKSLRETLSNEIKSWSSQNSDQRAKNYAQVYDHLKAYLMLGSQEKLDPYFASKVIAKFPHTGFLISASSEQMFLFYFTAMKNKTSHKFPVAIDLDLVKSARAAMVSTPDPKVMYQHLVSRGQEELGAASLQDLLKGKDQGMLVNAYYLPKMYTQSAFEKTILPMMEAIAENSGTRDWVLQESAETKRDKKTQQKWISELRALYFQDYAKHWIHWIAALQIKSFHSLDDAATKLGRLQDEEGPIATAIQVLDQNLSFDVPELKQTYQSIRIVTSKEPGKSNNELVTAYLKQLTMVQSELATLGTSSDPGRDADVYARKVLADTTQSGLSAPLQVLNGVEKLGSQPKQALNAFLRSPIEQSWRSILDAAALHIQQQWESEVVESYNQSLRGKFPFAKTHIEVALDDVTSFFNPVNGQLIQFQESVLKPYLKQSRGAWQEQEWLGQGIGFSKSFLNSLAQGQQISHALFKSKSSEPEFSFYIQPIPLPGIEEVIFDTNGQQYRYRNEPEEWRRFTWPGDASQIGARLYAAANQHKQSAELEHHGLWGLFHLLADAKFIKQGGTQYMTEWQLRDKNGQVIAVKIRMKADKQNNVLDPRVMMQFKLPETIANQSATRR